MAYEIPNFRYTLVSDVNWSATASLYLAVAVSTTTGNAVLPAAGAAIAGVLQNNPAVGQEAVIYAEGIVKCLCASACTPGIQVEVDGAGKFIPLATGKAVGYVIAGAGAGEIASIRLY